MEVKDIKLGKIDTLFGATLTCVVAAFIVIATAGVFFYHPGGQIVVESAQQTALMMPEVMPQGSHWGQWAKVLFAIGLFDAGLLGALCISLATSWAVGEVFGWAHSLNKSVREAPWFYVAYVAMLLSAAAVSLIASIPVQNGITIFVQVVAVTLLPPALIFLILILNDREIMGEHVNTRWQNIANWSITIFVVTVSTLYGVSVLFPSLFGAG
jgi:Mn2+/Fe2+ NRAMP family transporter